MATDELALAAESSAARQASAARPGLSARQLGQVWESSLDPMRLTDAEGAILRVNGAYCRLVGKPREALEGRPFTLGYEENGRGDALARHREQFASGRCESMALRAVTLWDGRHVHLEFSSSFLDG